MTLFEERINVKEIVEGGYTLKVKDEGICYYKERKKGKFCMNAQKLESRPAEVFDEETKVFDSKLGEKWYGSFGDVNYNLINSEKMCEKQDIVVLQKSVDNNTSYSMKLTLGDYGVINQSS